MGMSESKQEASREEKCPERPFLHKEGCYCFDCRPYTDWQERHKGSATAQTPQIRGAGAKALINAISPNLTGRDCCNYHRLGGMANMSCKLAGSKLESAPPVETQETTMPNERINSELIPRCEKLNGSTLRIVSAYTEAGYFCEANCVTIEDPEGRRALYVPFKELENAEMELEKLKSKAAPPATETQPEEWSPAVKKAMKTFNDAWARRKAAEEDGADCSAGRLGATETAPQSQEKTFLQFSEEQSAVYWFVRMEKAEAVLREKEAELAHEKARHCIGGDIFEAGRNELILNQQVELDYLQKIDRLEAELATAHAELGRMLEALTQISKQSSSAAARHISNVALRLTPDSTPPQKEK